MSRFMRRVIVALALLAWLHTETLCIWAQSKKELGNWVLGKDDQSRFTGDPRLLNPGKYDNPIFFTAPWDESGGLDSLPQQAKDILISHRIAQQQVELAIQYLKANRDLILSGSGRERKFFQTFGKISKERSAGMLEPSQTGGGSVMGGGTASPGSFQITSSGQSAWKAQIHPGDWIAIDTSGAGASFGSDAVFRRVERVESTVGGQETIYIDRKGQPIPSTGSFQNSRISKVLFDPTQKDHEGWRFLKRAQPEIFDQVLDTFQAIRSVLSGVDPTDPFQDIKDINYNKTFKAFGDLWGAGVGTFGGVNQDQKPRMPGWYDDNDPIYATNKPFVPDRRLREAGFSTSTSQDHIDVWEAERFGDIPTRFDTQTDRPLSDRGMASRQDKTTKRSGVIDALPLLWTEDNDDPSHEFFENRQMLFAGTNLVDTSVDIFDIYVGPRFYSGLNKDGFPIIRFASDDFLDWRKFAATGMTEKSRLITNPYGTDLLSDAVINPATGNPQFAQVFQPGSGTPKERQTELRQWQFIVRTFGEWSTNFDHTGPDRAPDVAVIGVLDMLNGQVHLFQGTVPPPRGRDLTLQARDAGQYARFAALMSAAGGGGGTGGVGRVGPTEFAGKRATAGFFPVVFRR